MILEVLLAAVSAGVLVALIAWGASCTRCTELRELPEKAHKKEPTESIMCENCVLYHKVCSAYGYCKIWSQISIDIVSPYKVCPFFAELRNNKPIPMEHEHGGEDDAVN